MIEAVVEKWTKNRSLQRWIDEVVHLCSPKDIWFCDGTRREYERFCQKMVESGMFIKLNESLRPNSFLARSDPNDVARIEECTYICSKDPIDAGPTNNWCDPKKMKQTLLKLFKGCMIGRTMYIIPFSMGPVGSKNSLVGIQITDSLYAVCNMHIMTRVGNAVLESLKDGFFVPCLHSVGMPLSQGQEDVPWPSNTTKYIVQFPEERSIWSFGSGYGGNALLGKKCFALRIASVIAKEEGWLAEHMLILGITNPEGRKKYFAASFPSACGKTNLAMLKSTLPGWKIETVGDDIAWMRFDADGILRAINPEAGFFGVAPGTSSVSNSNAMSSMRANSIFTNTALTDEGDVWWEGMTPEAPEHLINWLGHDWSPKSAEKAAQPNSRFTCPASQCPVIDPAWEDPSGVPISAIIFGGRRSSVVPLVREALNWQQGTFFGVSVSSETTAAAVGEVGKLRHDPFAMLPFCGYNMGDYFGHWLAMGKKTSSQKLPRIFYVNWFRKGKNEDWLWPGFGENIRVLKWIFERLENKADAVSTPIGFIPTDNSIDLSNIAVTTEVMHELLRVDKQEWLHECAEMGNYLNLYKPKLPPEITQELDCLNEALIRF